jgi:hypothetical protein
MKCLFYLTGSNNGNALLWDGSTLTIKGNLTPLNSEYVIKKVPLVEAAFDSDYWIIMDTVHFVTPMYSYLGWFSDNNFILILC